MNRELGKRWRFFNPEKRCPIHIKADFVVEIIDHNGTLKVISSINPGYTFKVGFHFSDRMNDCNNHCWTYLEGQDKP